MSKIIQAFGTYLNPGIQLLVIMGMTLVGIAFANAFGSRKVGK